jgi:hypothetical protein
MCEQKTKLMKSLPKELLDASASVECGVSLIIFAIQLCDGANAEISIWSLSIVDMFRDYCE